jgi:hypothetical protein
MFYVDPPYVGANQGHYSGWSDLNQCQLLEALDGCQGAFVLSGYEDAYTSKFASDRAWSKHEISVTIRAKRDSREKATEKLWCRERRSDPTGRADQVLKNETLRPTVEEQLQALREIRRRHRQSPFSDNVAKLCRWIWQQNKTKRR